MNALNDCKYMSVMDLVYLSVFDNMGMKLNCLNLCTLKAGKNNVSLLLKP